jgi:D-tyrosyl-tRNA(Tyr) deacylase
VRAVLQRVSTGRVSVAGTVIGSIGVGYVILLGIHHADTTQEIDWLIQKVTTLRVFADADNRFNRSLQDVNGAVLLISQFTLYADCRRGRRPDFREAATPKQAQTLYDYALSQLQAAGIHVESGEFGAHMHVELANDGPVTLVLEKSFSEPREEAPC